MVTELQEAAAGSVNMRTVVSFREVNDSARVDPRGGCKLRTYPAS